MMKDFHLGHRHTRVCPRDAGAAKSQNAAASMTVGLKLLVVGASSKQCAAQNDGSHAEINYQPGHVDQRGHERR